MAAPHTLRATAALHPEPRWTVVVPIKASARGKSRIAMEPDLRRQIAIALADDTVAAVAAAAAVQRIVVVTEDALDAARLAVRPKVETVVVAAPGLNAAITCGLGSVTGPVAVLPGDLPALTGDVLDAALAQVRAPVTVVADRQGVGTTLLAALDVRDLVPRYGGESFARHLSAGARALELPVTSGLRRDTDTLADLEELLVRSAGVAAGPPVARRTAAILAALDEDANGMPTRVRAC